MVHLFLSHCHKESSYEFEGFTSYNGLSWVKVIYFGSKLLFIEFSELCRTFLCPDFFENVRDRVRPEVFAYLVQHSECFFEVFTLSYVLCKNIFHFLFFQVDLIVYLNLLLMWMRNHIIFCFVNLFVDALKLVFVETILSDELFCDYGLVNFHRV